MEDLPLPVSSLQGFISSTTLLPTQSSEHELTAVKSLVAAPSPYPWDFGDQYNVQQMGAG